MTDLTSRIVVVAGASSGSGRAVASTLRSRGATVVALGSSLDRLEPVDADERVEVDLTDPGATFAVASDIRSRFGRVDGVLHLVGGWRGGQSDEDWDWLEPRVLGTVRNTSRAFREALNEGGDGRFAIVSSTAVARPGWSNANYATLKAAAETWTLALARGWAKSGAAAAVVYRVASLGADGTPVDRLAGALADLWSAPAAELNGMVVDLS